MTEEAEHPGSTSPQKKALVNRELPDVDIYEKPNFKDEPINEQIIELQTELKQALKDRKDIPRQCIAYNNLATAYHRLFKYDKAEICFHYHLQLGKPASAIIGIQEKRLENKNELKIAMVGLACVYRVKREYELALQTFRDALDFADELDDKASKARILNNISNVYEECCDFDSAIECQVQRMEIVTELGDVNGQIKSAATLGNLYCLKGELRLAIENFDKAVINLRMKTVKAQLDAIEPPPDGSTGEKVEDDPEFYDKGLA